MKKEFEKNNKTKVIVKYNNDFNIANLNVLDKIEQDILLSICSKFTSSKQHKIEFDYREIKNKAHMMEKKYSDKKFKALMISTQEKLLRINFTVRDEHGTRQRPLFREFYTPNEEGKVFIELDDVFLSYLYNIPQKIAFTQFELENFIIIKSKYAKTLFRFLLQNFNEKWNIDIKKLKEILGIPASYKTNMIIKTLEKCVVEINNTDIISNLQMELIRAKTQGNPIKEVIFQYKITKNKKEIEALNRDPFIPVTRTMTETVTEVVECNTKDNNDSSYDPPVKVVRKTQKREVEERCPLCKGLVSIKTDKNGKKYKYCENNKYWKLGSSDCDWQEYID